MISVDGSLRVSWQGHRANHRSSTWSLGHMVPRFEDQDFGLWEPHVKSRDWALSLARTLVCPSLTPPPGVCFGPAFGLAAKPVNHYLSAIDTNKCNLHWSWESWDSPCSGCLP